MRGELAGKGRRRHACSAAAGVGRRGSAAGEGSGGGTRLRRVPASIAAKFLFDRNGRRAVAIGLGSLFHLRPIAPSAGTQQEHQPQDNEQKDQGVANNPNTDAVLAPLRAFGGRSRGRPQQTGANHDGKDEQPFQQGGEAHGIRRTETTKQGSSNSNALTIAYRLPGTQTGAGPRTVSEPRFASRQRHRQNGVGRAVPNRAIGCILQYAGRCPARFGSIAEHGVPAALDIDEPSRTPSSTVCHYRLWLPVSLQ